MSFELAKFKEKHKQMKYNLEVDRVLLQQGKMWYDSDFTVLYIGSISYK